MTRDLDAIKKSGFIPQKQEDCFSLRLKVIGGALSSSDLEAISKVSRLYGLGNVHLTSRQSVEIPYIKLSDIDRVREFLTKHNLEPGVIGPGIRTITACQGAAICRSGLLDTGRLAKAIDRAFHDRELPHKFKIGVTGCRNNCLKAEENDIGIKGALLPEWSPGACNGCKLCVTICPGKAITGSGRVMSFNREKCLACGQCVARCSKKSWSGKSGALVYYGGIFGKRLRIGRSVLRVLNVEQDILKAISAGLDFFSEHGNRGERFAFTIERIGWDAFMRHLADRGLPLIQGMSFSPVSDDPATGADL